MIEFIPKGSMCRQCVWKSSNCSKLRFEKMRVIEVCKNTKLKVVKCDKYQKSRDVNQ